MSANACWVADKTEQENELLKEMLIFIFDIRYMEVFLELEMCYELIIICISQLGSSAKA